jgi:predicted acyltransferase
VLAGIALTICGLIFQWLQLCPIVKRIWTPSYTLYSGGLVVLMMAGFHALIEWRGWRQWSFPLLVIGANSIFVYVMSWTMEPFVSESLVRHLGSGVFRILGTPFEPVLRGASVLLVFWVILLWMYRKKIFVRI